MRVAKYAYARVLQKGQSLNKQLQAFSQYGVSKTNIFVDEKVGLRTAFGKLLQTLKKGDLLIIKTLTAINDGYENISCDWSRITDNIGADICIIDMPALDTRVGEDREVIVDVVTQVLNFCAEKEKAHSALQAKGIQSARQRGVKFGRPPKKYSQDFLNAVAKFRAKEITLEEALAATNMKQSSFYYHVHRIVDSGLLADKNNLH